VITTPSTSAVLVVRDGQVVGGSHGGSGSEVPLQLSAGQVRPAQAIPRSVRLVGCTSRAGSTSLLPGDYTLVAVLGYRTDSLNAAPADGTAPEQARGRSFVLISAPAAITVT
jgi:hypothetical protein